MGTRCYHADINISHGSVATPLRCGGICNDVFNANFLLRILKIGHYLAKLWTRVRCLVFLWTTMYVSFTKHLTQLYEIEDAYSTNVGLKIVWNVVEIFDGNLRKFQGRVLIGLRL